jgi:hypothetical protein
MTFMLQAYVQSNRKVQVVNWEEAEGGKKLGVF